MRALKFILRIFRWLVIAVAIIEIIFTIPDLGGASNQTGVIAKIIFWLCAALTAAYFEARSQKIKPWQIFIPAFSQKTLGRWLIIVIVWFIIALGFWWKLVFVNPERVFWDTIGNNFSTVGYSRLTSSKNQGVTELNKAQVQYGQYNIAETHIASSSPDSKLKAEVIATPNEEFLRYVEYSEIKDGTKAAEALGVWAKNDSGGQSNQSFSQVTLLLTLFPMGYVPASERASLIKFAQENTVYNPETNNVIEESVNGRNVYTYKVSVQLQSYAAMVQQFADAIGQSEAVAGISPADYADAPPLSLEVSIDPISRRIVRIISPGDDTTVEAYKGYGITSKAVKIPENPLSTLQLQELLQQN